MRIDPKQMSMVNDTMGRSLRTGAQATVSGSIAAAGESQDGALQAQRISGLRFDWLMLLLNAVFVGGLYLDGWAHNHGRVDQSFFTPWHAFFYGGFLLVIITFAAATTINRMRGYALALAIPTGYRMTGIGLFIFAAGGVGDLGWHQLFGVESGAEVLFSPTHIMLGVGIGMIVTGPLCAAWSRRGRQSSWRALAPAIGSLGLFLAVLTFFMMFFFPVTVQLGTLGTNQDYFLTDVDRVAGLVAATFVAATLTGTLLLSLRRWRLPLGAVSSVLGLAIAGGTILDYERPLMIWLALGMGAGALAVDYLAWRARPISNPNALRWLAPVIPLLLYGGYYAALLSTAGTTWSVHMWTSTIVIPALTCWLLSFLLLPPSMPDPRA